MTKIGKKLTLRIPTGRELTFKEVDDNFELVAFTPITDKQYGNHPALPTEELFVEHVLKRLDAIEARLGSGSTTPTPTPTTYSGSYSTVLADTTAKCGSPNSSQVGLVGTATASSQAAADAAAKAAAIAKIVCTTTPPVTTPPSFNTTLVGPKQDEPTGTQLTATSGDTFKFNSKPLGDGTGKVMQLTLDGSTVLGAIDFLTPYLSRLDGGAGGELFSFQPKGTGTIYYGRFKDIDSGLVTLSTSYAL